MKHSLEILLVLGFQASLLFSFSSAKRGYGTAYSGPFEMDQTGLNACQYDADKLDDTWQVYYAAMNEADWNMYGGKSGVCGRCLKVKGVQGHTTSGHKIKPVIVKIVDQCPEWACPKKEGHNIDFSTTALKAITGYDWDKKLIDWEFTSCDDTSGISIRNGRSTSTSTQCNEWAQYGNLASNVDHLTHKADCTKVLFCKNGKTVRYEENDDISKYEQSKVCGNSKAEKCNEWVQYSSLASNVHHLTHKSDCTKVLVCDNGDYVRYDEDSVITKSEQNRVCGNSKGKQCNEWVQYSSLASNVHHLTHKSDCTKVLVCDNGKYVRYGENRSISKSEQLQACK